MTRSQRARQLLLAARDLSREEHGGGRRIAAALIARLGVSSRLTIDRGAYKLRFHQSSYSKTLWADPERGLAEEELICRILSPGDRVVDVGANVGTIALRAASCVGPSGTVIAIEAHPRTFKFLAENVALNRFRNIEMVNVALGEETGTLFFSDLPSDDQNHIQTESGMAVPVVRLEDFLDTETAFLKIDVEGYEHHVLAGAGGGLNRVQLIQFEYFEQNFGRYGVSGADVLGLLRERGFILAQAGRESFEEIDQDFRTSECINLFALRLPATGEPDLSYP